MPELLNQSLLPDGIEVAMLDWDDTVVGTIEAKMRQHQYVAKTYYGIDLTKEEMASDWGKPLHELISKWYRIDPDDQAQYDKVLATVLSYSGEFPKMPFNGALIALEALRNRFYTGIVTGSPRNDLIHDFKLTGLSPESFDYFQASDDSAYHKPDKRVFDPANEWLASIGVAPSQVLYIGDSWRDHAPARENGYHFLGVETATMLMPAFYELGALSIRAIGDLVKQ